MHGGNLSFIGDKGQPYDIAPAYDMTPMAFQPRSGGGLPEALPAAPISSIVPNETWRQALELARAFHRRLQGNSDFSQRFQPCINAIGDHLDMAASRIERLG